MTRPRGTAQQKARLVRGSSVELRVQDGDPFHVSHVRPEVRASIMLAGAIVPQSAVPWSPALSQHTHTTAHLGGQWIFGSTS